MDKAHPAADGSREEEDHRPPPMSDGETTMPLCAPSPSPAWPLSPPTASHYHDPLSWALYPMYSPPDLLMTMMGLDVAGVHQGEPTAASLSVQSSPQAQPIKPCSPAPPDVLRSFKDRQISSPGKLDPVPAEVSHVPAALVAPQGTSPGGNPGSSSVRVEQINRIWQFHLSRDASLGNPGLSSVRVDEINRIWQFHLSRDTSIGGGLTQALRQQLKVQFKYCLCCNNGQLDAGTLTTVVMDTRAESMMHIRFLKNNQECGCPYMLTTSTTGQAFVSHQSARSLSFRKASMVSMLYVVGDSSGELVICCLCVSVDEPSKMVGYGYEIEMICTAQVLSNLRSTHVLAQHNLIFNDSRQTVPLEIKEILTVISEKYRLPLAQAWVLCNYENRCDMNGCLYANELAFHVVDRRMWGFRDACVQQHLQVGQGVPGKAFQFRGPCYVKDVGLFSNLEYPLVSYARLFGLVGSVAVCVQSCYTTNDDYILEFFLPYDCREDDEQMLLLESISALMELMACNFKIVGDTDFTKLSSHHLPVSVNEEQNTTSAERLRECRANKVKHVKQTSVFRHIKGCSSAEVHNAADKCSSMLCATTLLGIENTRQLQDKTTAALSPLSSMKKIVEVSNVKSHYHLSNGSGGDKSKVIELGHNDVEADDPASNKSRKRKGGISRKKSKVWPHFPEVVNTEDPGVVGTSRKKSKVWSHFTEVVINGVVKGKCPYCGTLLKADSRNGTSRLKRHITVHHKMDLNASPETNKKRAGLTIKTKIQAKDQTAAKCGGTVHGRVPNEVIILDSQGSVGKISSLERQLLDKINSASEEDILVRINDVTLGKKVMESLTDPSLEDGPQRYLQDDIINAYIHILKDRNRDEVRAHGKVFIENTFICRLLHSAGPEKKCLKEFGVKYLKHDMIFLPINQNDKHWYLAVINTREQEIQVLDSLGVHLQEREELNHILKQIERCLELASKEVESNSWPNYKVASWKVAEVEQIPKQTDMSSCGLFVIKYMEYWMGGKLSKEFTQADIDLFRLQLAPRLMTSPLNKAADKATVALSPLSSRKKIVEISNVKMELDGPPKANKKPVALTTRTKDQAKDQTAAKWGGIVPDKVPNEVIILDSQGSVGKISRLGQLLDKINSASEEEDDDATTERDEDVLQRRADSTPERNDVEDLDDIREVTTVARSGPRRPTTASRNTKGKEKKRLKRSASIEEMMEIFPQIREEESARLAKQGEEESARLAGEKEAAESNDFSIRRCISVLKTLEVTKEEKAKAYDVFIKSKENREAFIFGCEEDVESTLIWLRNKIYQVEF